MRTGRLLLAGVLGCLVVSLPVFANDEDVRKTLTGYVEAFNQHDADAIGGLLTEVAQHIDRESGQRTEGRQAILADLKDTFEQAPSIFLSGRVDRIRMIQPAIAQAEGETLVVGGTDPQPIGTRFSAILVKNDEGWKIDSIEEFPVPRPATAYDALRELEWLVGRWVDESDDVTVDTTYRWSNHQSFLIRSFSVIRADGTERQGTQVIGWDPRSQEIRSWTFNSDGSFGDAVWSRSSDGWLIRSSQTLADGRAASGTYILTRVDDDTITVQLVGHEIEGEPQPATAAVKIVRVVEAATPAEPKSE